MRVLPFQICPRVCLLLMRLPQPGDPPSAFPGLSCGLFFWSFTPIRSWASYDDGLYISLAHLWFFLCCLPRWLVILAVTTQSCWAPFGPAILFLFSVAYHRHCFVSFYSWAPMSLCFLLLGIRGPFANSTLPWALLLTSLGFPGPITLSLSLGFMSLP